MPIQSSRYRCESDAVDISMQQTGRESLSVVEKCGLVPDLLRQTYMNGVFSSGFPGNLFGLTFTKVYCIRW